MRHPTAWPLTLYYDGSCPLCAREIRTLRRRASPHQASSAASSSAIASRGEAGSCGHHQCSRGACAPTQAATLRAFVDCGDERKPCR